jgi:DNA ligase 1
MRAFAQLCEQISQTTKKTVKAGLLATYFRERPMAEASTAAVFLSGRPFPAYEEATLNVGGALLSRAIIEVSQTTSAQLSRAYHEHGDLGSAAHDLFLLHNTSGQLQLNDAEAAFRAIAQTPGTAAKSILLRSLLAQADALEVKYLVKIMTGDLRIGLRESLVEESIAKAFDVPHADVRRANMLLGDVGATLRLAAEHRLNEARMRLFHPIGMMLANPVQTAEEAASYFTNALIEDKYDGVRAQAHYDGKDVRIFSRTSDEITASFPGLAETLSWLPGPVILDGEILAWQDGRSLPFSVLQARLGRKSVDAGLIRAVPVAYVVFDVLFAEGRLWIDEPLRKRRAKLESIFARARVVTGTEEKPYYGSVQTDLFRSPELVPLPPVMLAPVYQARTAPELEQLFESAQARGNEGLMVKDATSLYLPGRRGKSWLKLKRELARLDVVVTSVEWGHGKRAHVLSDVTFAVRDGERLVNVGKAYSGLTDTEISELTQWFLANTLVDHGQVRDVAPKIVLEVAFNNVMESDRHESGYALRFPRILRLRPDKPVEEIDTVARVRELFTSQHRRSG